MVRTGGEDRWSGCKWRGQRRYGWSWLKQVAMLGGQDKCIGQVETTGGEDRWRGQVVRTGGQDVGVKD